jgi:chaperonin GroEL
MKLETAEMSVLGTAKKVTISKDETIILDGAGEKAAIEERCEWVQGGVNGVREWGRRCCVNPSLPA